MRYKYGITLRGLGLDSGRQEVVNKVIASYGGGRDCGQLATLTDTYRRLSNKTDKSSSTRVAAGEMADQIGQAYVECMAAKGAASVAPTPTPTSTPTPVQTPTQAPSGGSVIERIANALVPKTGISTPQSVSTPAQDNTIRYLLYGGIALTLVVGGVWAYKRYRRGK